MHSNLARCVSPSRSKLSQASFANPHRQNNKYVLPVHINLLTINVSQRRHLHFSIVPSFTPIECQMKHQGMYGIPKSLFICCEKLLQQLVSNFGKLNSFTKFADGCHTEFTQHDHCACSATERRSHTYKWHIMKLCLENLQTETRRHSNLWLLSAIFVTHISECWSVRKSKFVKPIRRMLSALSVAIDMKGKRLYLQKTAKVSSHFVVKRNIKKGFGNHFHVVEKSL